VMDCRVKPGNDRVEGAVEKPPLSLAAEMHRLSRYDG
jgi:hypothetical protein